MRIPPADAARRGAVLLAFLALSGLYFTHTYVYAPKAERMEAANLRLARLGEGARSAEAGAAVRAAELEERLALYEDYIGRLEKLIPAREEVAALLEAVSDAEREAGVEMTMMRPEPVEPGDHYDRLSYRVAVTGGYHEVGSFLTAIASLERIVAPADLAIASGSPSGADGEAYEGTVSASFRIRTYVVTPARPPGPSESPASNGAPSS